jgi:hypothetical protein
MAEVEPVHRCLLSVDIEKSGDPRRDNEASVRTRQVLFTELEKAFEASGIDWASCTQEDTGDGMIVAIPPPFPKRNLLHPFLERLAEGLRYHNRYTGGPTRIRLRVAVHEGDVRIDTYYGMTGRPKVLLARLLDAQPLREALASAPPAATVAALVSDRIHEDVVLQGYRDIDPETYTPVTVRVKETEVRAWLHLPGHHLKLAATEGSEEKGEPARKDQPTSRGVTITGTGDIHVGHSIVGGDQHIYRNQKPSEPNG